MQVEHCVALNIKPLQAVYGGTLTLMPSLWRDESKSCAALGDLQGNSTGMHGARIAVFIKMTPRSVNDSKTNADNLGTKKQRKCIQSVADVALR